MTDVLDPPTLSKVDLSSEEQARKSTAKRVLVATETGMLHQLEVLARLPERAV